MYGPGDARVEERDVPEIIDATDAIIRLAATCICGSDLWPYRGAEPHNRPRKRLRPDPAGRGSCRGYKAMDERRATKVLTF